MADFKTSVNAIPNLRMNITISNRIEDGLLTHKKEKYLITFEPSTEEFHSQMCGLDTCYGGINSHIKVVNLLTDHCMLH